jgi:hypothetical protein
MKIAISQTRRTDHRRCSRLSIDPFGKGANSCDSFSLQKERHPGAGCFIGSRAVKDDISMARDFLVTMLNLFQSHAQSAGYHNREGPPGILPQPQVCGRSKRPKSGSPGPRWSPRP